MYDPRRREAFVPEAGRLIRSGEARDAAVLTLAYDGRRRIFAIAERTRDQVSLDNALVETRGVIAIVDDEEPIRVGLASLMRSVDLIADTFPSADAFLESDIGRYFCVLSDIQMPGASGLDLLAAVRTRRPNLPVILMTAFPDDRSRAQAAAQGCHRFLTKPGDPDEIIDLLDRLLPEP